MLGETSSETLGNIAWACYSREVGRGTSVCASCDVALRGRARPEPGGLPGASSGTSCSSAARLAPPRLDEQSLAIVLLVNGATVRGVWTQPVSTVTASPRAALVGFAAVEPRRVPLRGRRVQDGFR